MGLTATPLIVLGLSFLHAAAVEALSWLVVYRTPTYKRLKDEVERQAKRLEAVKSTGASNVSRSKAKKEQRLEGNVKNAATTIASARFKTGAIRAVLTLLMWRLLARLFGGVVAAKLPFEAASFMRRATHQGLDGEDWTQCAAPFLFFASSVAFSGNLQKLLGVAPSRAVAKLTTAQNWAQQMEDAAKASKAK